MQQATSGTSAATYKLMEPNWAPLPKKQHKPCCNNYPISKNDLKSIARNTFHSAWFIYWNNKLDWLETMISLQIFVDAVQFQE